MATRWLTTGRAVINHLVHGLVGRHGNAVGVGMAIRCSGADVPCRLPRNEQAVPQPDC